MVSQEANLESTIIELFVLTLHFLAFVLHEKLDGRLFEDKKYVFKNELINFCIYKYLAPAMCQTLIWTLERQWLLRKI